MIFVARKLLVKSHEYDDTLYTPFVGLRKAYDSVSRRALCKVLVKIGVTPKVLKIVKSFHENM